ncbi:protein ycf2 [Striga asiatica]|uniref:Protein ycf2 n=1 Tax=Striga asiatica TaxID=4170 RepID=A0A5A7PNB5_STRAF|nr:protein ycf2 [Striga asiatica]
MHSTSSTVTDSAEIRLAVLKRRSNKKEYAAAPHLIIPPFFFMKPDLGWISGFYSDFQTRLKSFVDDDLAIPSDSKYLRTTDVDHHNSKLNHLWYENYFAIESTSLQACGRLQEARTGSRLWGFSFVVMMTASGLVNFRHSVKDERKN